MSLPNNAYRIYISNSARNVTVDTYFTKISNLIPNRELENTKYLTLVFIECMDYIYKNKLKGEHNEQYEKWLDPASINSFRNTTFYESICKKFLNQFRINFN